MSKDKLKSIMEKQRKIFEHYGKEKQLDMLAEECAELIQAIMKFKRYSLTISIFNDLLGEMADVLNVIEQFVHAFGVEEEISEIQEIKLDRELERITERDNKNESIHK